MPLLNRDEGFGRENGVNAANFSRDFKMRGVVIENGRKSTWWRPMTRTNKENTENKYWRGIDEDAWGRHRRTANSCQDQRNWGCKARSVELTAIVARSTESR